MLSVTLYLSPDRQAQMQAQETISDPDTTSFLVNSQRYSSYKNAKNFDPPN